MDSDREVGRLSIARSVHTTSTLAIQAIAFPGLIQFSVQLSESTETDITRAMMTVIHRSFATHTHGEGEFAPQTRFGGGNKA